MAQVKEVKKVIKDDDLTEMFNQMVGATDPDVAVVGPKYNELSTILRKVTLLLEQFTVSIVRKDYPEFEAEFKEIEEFIVLLKELDSPLRYDSLMPHPENDKKIGELYVAMKASTVINTLFVSCKNLSAYRRYIGNKEALSDKFIINSPSADVQLLPFTHLNFKEVYFVKNRMTAKLSEYILLFLHILLNHSTKIYNICMSPDVNISQFSDSILTHIEQIKKQIPRCDLAFKKIAESIDLLQDNFDGYYKDFMETNNPTTIIENFIIDVSTNTKGNMAVMQQFKTIINYYRKATQSKIGKDPKLKKIFSMLDQNFQTAESQMAQEGDNGGNDVNDGQEEQEVQENQNGSTSTSATSDTLVESDNNPTSTNENIESEPLSKNKKRRAKKQEAIKNKEAECDIDALKRSAF